MSQENRRGFLRKLGLTIGALTFGPDPLNAIVYQKKTTPRMAPAAPAPAAIDFRNSPEVWRSPISTPGRRVNSFVTENGGLIRLHPAVGDGVPDSSPDSVAISFEGWADRAATSQKCDTPGIPRVTTSITSGEARAEMIAFSTFHEDEGAVDNVRISVVPGNADLTLRLAIRSAQSLSVSTVENDDVPRGELCAVTGAEGTGETLFFLDAPVQKSSENGVVVLRAAVGRGEGSAPVTFLLRIPSTPVELDALVEGAGEIAERMEDSGQRWASHTRPPGKGGLLLPVEYAGFFTASVRITDQLRESGTGTGEMAPVSGVIPDLTDEHFIMESEMYSGREAEARSRLEKLWNLENDQGEIIGAGGEANMKEMAAAIFSLCRHAELSGDWKYFDELYPDAFNALNSLRQKRDTEMLTGSPNGSRNLLPPGSLGVGWQGEHPELTNTLWTLMAAKFLLEISDRQFLPKKSEIREFYGQLRLAFMLTSREEMVQHPGEFRYLPMTIGEAATAFRPQEAQGTFAAAVSSGLLFRKEDIFVEGFQKLMEAVSEEDIPVGTGPGSGVMYLPRDAALMGQYYIWAALPESARKYFAGFLNHASPVFTWSTAQLLTGAGSGEPQISGGPGLDLRSSAECVRYLRHMMVFEDEKVLRLFDGVAEADLGDYKPLEIVDTPTRWGRVSLRLEPVDKRTWTINYSRTPVNPSKAPPLESVELPRVLAPNFRFDTINGSTAIKNGPRVIIDGNALKWDATLRNLMR